MLKIFNSIFPKVCKNGFRTFVPGTLELCPSLVEIRLVTSEASKTKKKKNISLRHRYAMRANKYEYICIAPLCRNFGGASRMSSSG